MARVGDIYSPIGAEGLAQALYARS